MRSSISNALNRIGCAVKKNLFILFNRNEYHLLNHNIFVAYTMGKVGSVTIEKAIAARVFYNPVFHLHFLSKEGLKKHKEFNKSNSGYELASDFETERNNNKQKRLKIITLVRDPISRDISDLFQNYRTYIPEQKRAEINLEQMIAYFKKFDHDYALEWFDVELGEYLGIDIYKYEFDKGKMYQIIKDTRFDLLIIRLEDLSKVFDIAMYEFTGTRNWRLLSEENNADDKFYAEVYSSFKKNVTIDNSILDKVYNSKYFNHFYSEAEKKKYIDKWKRIQN